MSFHLYDINELYSSADGSIQFIELTVGNFNGESKWEGHSISSARNGVTNTFVFPSDLPSTSTANTTVLIATQAFADLGIVTPDFIVPSGFLFTSGGTLNYAGVDVVNYPQLPGDGEHSVTRTGAQATATPKNFAGVQGSLTGADTTAPAVSTFSPADEASGVAIASNMVITFSEAIARGAGSIVLKNAAGATIESFDAASSARLTIAGSTLTVNPTSDLAFGTGYRLEFASGTVKDLAGNSYAGTTAYNFTTIAAPNSPPTGSVSVTGTATQGQTLSADTSTLADADGLGALSYQWLRSGNAITGATGSSYALVQSDVSGLISVRVSYTDGHGTAQSVTSTATSAVANVNDLPTGTVTITGSPTLGQVLTATNDLADVDGLGDIGYQWRADGTIVAGASSSTFTLTQAEVGKTITVEARYTDGFGAQESKTSNPTAAVADSDTTAPTATNFSPADEAVDVAVGSPIVISFSEAVARGVGSIVLKNADDATIETFDAASSARLAISGSILTIDPTNDLGFGTGYKLELDAGAIQDLAGNPFAGTSSYNFATVADANAETFTGTDASESFTGGAGNDTIDGGLGIDTAMYSGGISGYLLSKVGDGFTLTDLAGADGTDTLHNVERLKFSDRGIALDTGATQAAGETQLLLGAVLGKDLLAFKKPLIGVVIDLFDQGFTMQQLSGAIMRLPIWGLLANGGVEPAKIEDTYPQIATYLLTTVNQAPPDAPTLAAAVAALNTETGVEQGNFLWHLAESPENQQQVGLVGLTTTGLEFGGLA